MFHHRGSRGRQIGLRIGDLGVIVLFAAASSRPQNLETVTIS